MRTSAPVVDRDTQARLRSVARTRDRGAVETVRRLQQTAGNRAVVRWLARDGIRRPEERYPRVMEGGLQLDPELIRTVLRPILSAENLLDHLAEARPSSGALSMRDPRRPSPIRPPPDPADPPGFERPAERAGASTFLSAVKAVPEVKRALENVEYQVWGRLSSDDRTTLVTTGITFGAAALGGMLATPGGREMLGKLSGIPLTVPKAPWLAFEFSTQQDVIGLGVHVDVGQLLGGRLGFGKAGPRSGGGPLLQRERRLQRSTAQWVEDQRSWWRKLLYPGPRIEVPDAARRLKGKERQETREKNTAAYWRDPEVAAKAFDKLRDVVYELVLNYWNDAVPSVEGLVEEIEDAFSAPAMSERSGPARDYARYVRARRSAAHAILSMHLNKHLSTPTLKQVWIASDAQVPEAPPHDPSLEDDKVAYPGTDLDFTRRAKELYVRLEAMRQLATDKAGGGMRRERLIARGQALYEFLQVEFSHGPLPDKTKGGSGAYDEYLEARIAVAKWALDHDFQVPPQARKQMESQAEAAKQPYLYYGRQQYPDHQWEKIEKAAWHEKDAAVRNEAADFDADMTSLLWKIDSARRAVRERRQTTNVSPALTKTVQEDARRVFGKPPRAISKPNPILRRFHAKYLIFRHEYARLVTVAKLTPAEVAQQLKQEAEAKLSPVRAINDPDAVDKAERDQGLPGHYAEHVDDFDLAVELDKEVGSDHPAHAPWWDLRIRVGALKFAINRVKDVVRDRRAGEKKPFWADSVVRDAREEFQTRPPDIPYKHLAITRMLEEYRALRHKFALMLIEEKLVPDDIKTLVENEARRK